MKSTRIIARQVWIMIALSGSLLSSALAADIHQGNFGAELSSKPKKPSSAPAKRNNYPFSGELDSHDAKSITLKGKRKSRVLLVTPDTRVLKNGSKAKLADAAIGERVSGSARKNGEGKEEAVTINLKGPKGAEK
jgi:hypothetical protein